VKPEPPAPPPPKTYAISVSKTGKGEVVPDKATGVKIGESITLVATAQDPDWAVYSAKSNSTVYEVPFMSTVYPFTITITNADQNAEVVFVKKVDLWTSKDRWYLWIRENQYADNEPWYVQNLSAQQYTDYMVFTLEGKLSWYHSNGERFGGPYDYSISGETLTVVMGIVYKIKRLDDTMIIEHDVFGAGAEHIHARETFKHTPKP